MRTINTYYSDYCNKRTERTAIREEAPAHNVTRPAVQVWREID